MKKDLSSASSDESTISRVIDSWDGLALALNRHAIVSITDVRGEILYVNDLFCEISGYSAQELLGQDHRMIKSDVHPPAFYQALWHTISSGKNWQGEICNKRKDGRYYWVESTITPILDDSGKPVQFVSIRTDITEVKLAEERLRRGQIYANIGTWDWDIRTGDLYWSEKVFTLLGLKDGELKATFENFVDAIHPDDRAMVQQSIEVAFSSAEAYEIEHRVVWPDGTEHWVQERGAVRCDKQGNPVQMLGVVQDVNERKIVQLELEERTKELEHAQQVARLASWHVDLVTRKFKASDNVFEIYGLNRSDGEIDIDTLKNAVLPEDEWLFDQLGEQLKENGRYDITHRILRPDGDIRTLHIAGSVIKNAEGKYTHILGAIQDITHRLELEQRLRDTEQRFVFAVEGAGDGVWDLDLVNNVVQSSAACWTMLGYDDMPERRDFDGFASPVCDEDKQKIGESLEDYISGRSDSYSVQVRMRCKDGELKWVLCRGTIVEWDAEGKPVRMTGINSDITESKDNEAALIAARNEAEKANQAKSEFLSNMSHELRTPMNAILGFGQLLELDESLSEENSEYAHEILKAGEHLLDLINEILDLARVESGRIMLSIESVSVPSVLSDIVTLLGPLLAEKNISLDTSELEGCAVKADRVRLKQVLINLLSNAIKYNREGGRVCVLSNTINDGVLRITVADTGFGIAPDQLGDVFQPFNRLGAETSSIEGTGIGLTLTKRLVEMMGGSIGVDSVLGEGSRFWIEFETAEQSDEDVGESKENSGEVGETVDAEEKTVLYIDDNPSNLKLVKNILRRIEHIRVVDAHNAELGLELAKSVAPDLVLVDINMPDIDGYQVLGILKGNADFAHVPIVAVSANAMPSEIEKGLSSGFSDYISKPFDIGYFKSVVKRFLETESQEKK